jgi:hypothetical protein
MKFAFRASGSDLDSIHFNLASFCRETPLSL